MLGPQIKSSLPLVKLKHSHVHLLRYYLWRLSRTAAKLSSCDEERLTHKAKHSYSLVLYEIVSLIPKLISYKT